MRLPSYMLQDEVTLERYAGAGAYGDTFSASETVKAHVDATRRVVVAQDGQQAISEATVYTRPMTEPEVESKVTWNGREYRVVAVKPMSRLWGDTGLEISIGQG